MQQPTIKVRKKKLRRALCLKSPVAIISRTVPPYQSGRLLDACQMYGDNDRGRGQQSPPRDCNPAKSESSIISTTFQVTLLAAVASTPSKEMSQRTSGNVTSYCYVGLHRSPGRRQRPHLGLETPNSTGLTYSSAGQIGQRLAVIGDEFNRTYEARIHNKMAHVLRESIRIFSNCQGLVSNVLRSVTNFTSRVDHGVTPTAGRTSLVHRSTPGKLCHSLLFLAVLAAVCGLVFKLGLETI
ncbi:uncharacterized protein [Hyperolius riggenbachi]|uniref:uncharacterized protein n=1 Tax=Hyperolius riggenbachi TaxID=752182 RepID=UPI0035A26D3C